MALLRGGLQHALQVLALTLLAFDLDAEPANLDIVTTIPSLAKLALDLKPQLLGEYRS